MTKQKTAEFAEELIKLFDFAGWEMQEAMYADLVRRGPEEMEQQFAYAEALLRGLESTAEDSVGFGAYLILGEARQYADLARYICETHAK
jgi:hypothetical protein